MGEFLDRYTEDRPLLLITEDLHWSDRPTIQLIDFLARRRSSARVMWLSSFRLAEVVASDHQLNALRHELRLHGLCEEIVLDSFSEAEVAAYLAERLPAIAKDESAVRALHERTEGVPLFVASMASDIAARSARSGVGTAELLATSAVPENLLAIIEHYASKLGNERRSLLSAAAVCGIEFRVDSLSRVLERDVVEVAEECERLLREQLWLARCARWEPRRRTRRTVLVPPCALPASALRSDGVVRASRSTSQSGHRARTRAGGRPDRLCRAARDALRPRPLADGSIALLRGGGGSGAHALGSRRMHGLDRTRVESRVPRAGRCPTNLVRDRARDASRCGRVSHARRRRRSAEGVHARALAANRCPAASDAGPAVARGRTGVESARRVRRGSCDG